MQQTPLCSDTWDRDLFQDRARHIQDLTSTCMHAFFEQNSRQAQHVQDCQAAETAQGNPDNPGNPDNLAPDLFPSLLATCMAPEIRWTGPGGASCTGAATALPRLVRAHFALGGTCRVTDESYDVLPVTREVYLCTGRARILPIAPTDRAWTGRKQIAALFRYQGDQPMCLYFNLGGQEGDPALETVTQTALSGSPDSVCPMACIPDARTRAEGIQLRRSSDSTPEEQAELASIFDEASCCILRLLRTASGNYHLLRFNRALEQIIGVPSGQIVFLDWSTGFGPAMAAEDLACAKKKLDSLVRPGDAATIEYRYRDRDGKTHYLFSQNAVVSADETGTIVQRILFDITDRAEKEAQLLRLSEEDGLTHLFNRSKFIRYFEGWYKARSRQLGVASLDINGLKCLNDSCGHSAGDKLLLRVARHLKAHFSRIFRIGGDEFVIVEEEMQEQAFTAAMTGLLKSLLADDIQVAVGMSWRGANCDLEEQLEESDRLMYRDKQLFYEDPANERRGRRETRRSA